MKVLSWQKVDNHVLRLYALKLLKDQSRYLGKRWRLQNMTVLSAIDKSVRHHIHDAWFYENHGATEPCGIKEQDAALYDAVDAFNDRLVVPSRDEIQPRQNPGSICLGFKMRTKWSTRNQTANRWRV